MGIYNYVSNYDDIIFSDDPSNVENVSMLRHYINCHCITNKLIKYLNLTIEQIYYLTDNLRGSTDIFENMSSNFKNIVDAHEREENSRLEAALKNAQLIDILEDKRKSICGIGTRKLKLFLNKKIKEGDINAKIYRIALETEDTNIKAKNTIPYYKDKVYVKKEALLKELISICKNNNVQYGYQKSDNYSAAYVIFFELPDMEQISFHSNISSKEIQDMPKYEKDWDGLVNSTLDKIEKTLNKTYFS